MHFMTILKKIKTFLTFKALSKEKKSLSDEIFALCNCRFTDEDLLNQAFLHSSAIDQDTQTRTNSYERMEFLGDAVLELIVSRFLYENFPEYSDSPKIFVENPI